MKNFIIKGLASVLAVASLASCSSDYLDVTPKTAVTTATVENTQEGAQAALYGLCRAMYYPMNGNTIYDYLGANGESFLMVFYGDVMGQDYFSYFWGCQMGNNFNWSNNRLNNGWMPAIGWTYCYNLISQANRLIVNNDKTEGDRDVLDFIKAQALTMRAHGYFRLLQLYAPRWENANNGEVYVAPLRLDASTSDVPLAKMKDIIAQIRADLDEALEIYNRTTTRRHYWWEPDEDIAYGVYSRLGLLIHDFPTAQKMAASARAPYSLMTAEEYLGGFAERGNSYMWCNPVEPAGKNIGYFSHGAYYACQGAYPTIWGFGAGSINYELYREMPNGDIRRKLFFTPDKLQQPTTLRATSFWNAQICDPATMDLAKLNPNMKIQLMRFGQSAVPNGDKDKFGQPYVCRDPGQPSNPIIAFGAQYKFWGVDMYGTNSFPFMRAEEMLLNEAEAACYNGDEAAARKCLEELIALRNPGQSVSSLSGDALLKAVKLQRRIELWGEGFNWFDFKRWNEPMIRRVWEAGNVNSNNIPASYRLEKAANDPAWRYIVPITEAQYNNAIDMTLVQ